MKTKFTPEEVKKIARLSSLELAEKETEVFAKQFSTILEYFQILKEVEIPDINYNSDENHLSIGREDKVVESNISAEKFSPYMENGFFKVPKIIDPDH
ncbi:MAG: Asp-tRNA(Asn)/Glu-tRNA(Gln) amidotransferase GatCAB subunit C [Deltaproteobacteria bacterium]|nr:Asp-tRNA(Asn)/Glu-tRNA(Gln) amidotransferase GatCAB subunit C [Deltaproteobacteria bacterium]|tara:strand:+ start:950 stop:1243 length:294 start_codon:yes stop_codon:yes gene_type:complete